MIRSPCSPGWDSAAPSPSWLASVCSVKGLVQSGQTNTGAVVSRFFRPSKAFCFSSPHSHLAFFLNSRCKRAATCATSLMNRLYHDISPRKRRASSRFPGSVSPLSRPLCWGRFGALVHRRRDPNISVLPGRIYISPGSVFAWYRIVFEILRLIFPSVSKRWWYTPLCLPGRRMRGAPCQE